ncbi:helix-turn-helix transcriptional regulator [Ruthenibacterium sp. CLA-JM-H11]|uniref:Helix-turn-helix transcriptional regulator n=1 Tax=Ruthenibacterium intestinale TaxID=3133163 RepID=A0ABV1GII5_9FIRM
MSKRRSRAQGNLCAQRVRLGRALQKPPMTQEDLARKLQLMGAQDMTKLIISRIENNQRHVYDLELSILAQALNVSMEWLVGEAAENDYPAR